MAVEAATNEDDLDPRDLEIEVSRSSSSPAAIVRITHTPTGKIGEATHPNSEEARQRAMADLKEKLNTDPS